MLKENLLDVKQKRLKSALSRGKEQLWIETGLESDEEKLQRSREKEQREKKILYMYRGAAAFIVMLSGTAIYIEASLVCLVAFSISMVTAPYVVYQKKKRIRMDTLRDVINDIGEELGELRAERKRLTETCDELCQEVSRLKSVESSLKDIAIKQGTNVDSLCSLVKQNDLILKEMNKNVIDQVLVNVGSLILQSDKDGDFNFSEKELNILMLKIENLELVHIEDENKFRVYLRHLVNKAKGCHTSLLTHEIQTLLKQGCSTMVGNEDQYSPRSSAQCLLRFKDKTIGTSRTGSSLC